DLDLVGQDQAVAALPVLLGDEQLHELAEPPPLAGVEVPEVDHVALEHARPLVRKRRLQQALAPPLVEPTKDHGWQRSANGACRAPRSRVQFSFPGGTSVAVASTRGGA